MKPRSSWLLACLLVGPFWSQRARACSCVEYLNAPGESLQKSGLVFAGTVISVEVLVLPRIGYTDAQGVFVPSQYMERRALVTLRTTREWKGDGSSEYRVLAGAPPETPLAPGHVLVDCQVHLELGKEYLVFTSPEGYAEANPCAPTGLLEERSAVVIGLDRYLSKKKAATLKKKAV